MFKKTKFKKALVITLVLIMSLTTVAVAANEIYTKQLTATYGRIKFKVDGKDVTKEIESKYKTPAFTADDRSYVPVRAIAELMGMEVTYDNATHTAELTDVKAKEYTAELTKKDAEITRLERQITILEKELEVFKKDVVEETKLKSLEKKLNKDFGTYKNVDFNISLKENKNNITVNIDVDFYNTSQETYWYRMNPNQREDLVEDIVDIIAKEFKNVDITGSVYDSHYRTDLITFTKRTNRNISFSHRDGRDGRDGRDDGYRYDEFIYDAEDYLITELSKVDYVVDVDYIDIYENQYGEIVGTIDLYTSKYPYRSDLQRAFINAEDDLRYRYNDNYINLDIDVYLDDSNDIYGTYHKRSFTLR